MSERSEVEQELMDASKFKSKNYPDRQDELAALVRACERMPDALFNDLSDEAADWYNKAATAMNEHEDIPDFEEPEDADDEDTSDDHDHEGDEAADDDSADSDSDDDSPDDDDDADTDDDAEEVNEGSIEEDEPDEVPKKAKRKNSRVSEESQRDDDEDPPKRVAKAPIKGKRGASAPAEGDDDEPPQKAAKRTGKKAKTEPVEESEAEPEDDDADEAVAPKVQKPKQSNKRTPYDDLSGEKDRYGLFYGTKTQQAVVLYEKGATCKQVEMELNGRHRNILKRLAKEGHRVEKLEGGVFRVTHIDDVAKEGKKDKKK
jgi:hypothetical protein